MKRFANALLIVLYCAWICVASSCKGWTEDEYARAVYYNSQLAKGATLTPEEVKDFHDLLIKGKESGIDWSRVMDIGGAIIGSLTGVRIWRGSINSRNGTIAIERGSNTSS